MATLLAQQHRLRRGRASLIGQVYHITTRTNRDRPLFSDFGAARVVIDTLREIQDDGTASTLCFVVMPDHLHWLCRLDRDVRLAELMQVAKGRSSRRLSPRLELDGPVWQRGYYDRAIRREDDLASVARYIVANPVRAGIVRRAMDYPHWDCVWV